VVCVGVIGRDDGDVGDPRLGSEARCWDGSGNRLVSGDDDGLVWVGVGVVVVGEVVGVSGR
jgi:hypothetical protein